MARKLKDLLTKCIFSLISLLLEIYSKKTRLRKKRLSNSMKLYYNLIHSKFVLTFIRPPENFCDSQLILHSNELESHARDNLPEMAQFENVWFVPDLRAVYKDDGELIRSSILRRGTKMCRVPPSIIDVKQFKKTDIVDKALFGGIMLGKHYGHFLIETLSRLWPLAIPDKVNDFLDYKILYWSQEKKATPVEKSVIKSGQMLLESLRIKSNVSILDQPVHINKLIIPAQAATLNNEFYSIFRDLLRLAGTSVLSKHRPSKDDNEYPEKVYLSRTKLPYYRRNNANEKLLESMLKRHGFRIIHPQELSLPDQICMFSKARIIVGSFGSAFHTMLLSDISNQKMLCLTDDCPDQTSTGIDRICNAKTEYIRCIYPHPFCIKESGSGATKDKIIDVKRALSGILQYV
ncbi:MAG: glycosyltransferase family 61 protein [Planctomycetota bacterium]|jgi:hypothetical protein